MSKQQLAARSNYDYVIDTTNKTLFIVDMSPVMGGMTVTNNIENIVDFIFEQWAEEPIDYKIAYMDSDGSIDGWDYKRKGFVYIEAENEEEAFEKL